MLNAPRGLHDLFGLKLRKYQHIVNLLKDHVSSYSYEEIQTPVFEYLETFVSNDIDSLTANKELFYLEGKKYVLRPENTASVVRAVISNNLLNTQEKPLSLFYVGTMYRHERPQQGRYREFTQFGLEKIGASSIDNELEMIQLIEDLLSSIGLKCSLHINYLGPLSLKEECNTLLTEYFSKHIDALSPLSQKRVHTNPLRIFDDSLDASSPVCQGALKILDIFYENAKDKVDYIKDTLDKWKISYVWDPTLVRGIDYYTGLVFEWKFSWDTSLEESSNEDSSKTKELTLIAGGRYDELFEKFKAPSTPAIGLAIGIDRFVEALDKVSYQWNFESKKSVYVAYLTDKVDDELYQLIRYLRSTKINVILPWVSKHLKDHFKASERSKADYVLIYGDQERDKKEIVLKNQLTKEQTTISLLDRERVVAFIEGVKGELTKVTYI